MCGTKGSGDERQRYNGQPGANDTLDDPKQVTLFKAGDFFQLIRFG